MSGPAAPVDAVLTDRVFGYPADLPETLRRAARLRRLVFWPLFLAPFLAFAIAATSSLTLYVLVGILALAAVCEGALCKRQREAADLAATTVEPRGRKLVHVCAGGTVLAEVDLDAPFSVRHTSFAAGNVTTFVRSATGAAIVFTNHLSGADGLFTILGTNPPRCDSG